MIFTLILNFFYALLNFLIEVLPTGNLPAGFTSALNYFWSVVNAFSYIIPVGTLLSALLIMLAFDLAVLVWHFVQWIIRKIPGMQ